MGARLKVVPPPPANRFIVVQVSPKRWDVFSRLAVERKRVERFVFYGTFHDENYAVEVAAAMNAVKAAEETQFGHELLQGGSKRG